MKALLTTLLLPFAATVLAADRTTAPSGCITVDGSSSSSATFSTIQSAVDSLSTTASGTQCIFVAPGVYDEQVLVPAREAQLTIYGSTSDTTSYAANTVTITHNLSQASSGLNNDGTATLRVKAADFKLYNVNVANTYGEGSQAVALSAYAASGYYACQFTGFQDTVLANQGNQVYAGCLIAGATDFIFGQYAPAWFEQCDLRVVTADLGYVTANGRADDTGTSYYVFNKCDIAAADGATVAEGAYYLGRPWRAYARVVFQETSMSDVINEAGWKIWTTDDTRTDGVLFGEFENTGAGASGTRASFATNLTAAVQISEILGSSYASDGYYDSTYF